MGGQTIKCEIISSVIGELRLMEIDGLVRSISLFDPLSVDHHAGGLEPADVSGSTIHGARLKDYFLGEFTALDGWAVDLQGTPFQLKVWSSLNVIPVGETRSYKWLAHHIGCPTSIRSVANAVGRNPILVGVPCHRVISTGGGVGGFTGGLWRKVALLEHEGAECVGQRSLL